MALALTEDERDLVAVAATYAERHADPDKRRAALDAYPKGERTADWDALIAQGLHAVHLPEDLGGIDAGLNGLAVIVEEFGRTLLPGPFVPTVLASALLAFAADTTRPEVAELLAAFGEGATAAVITDGLTARADGDGWVLDGTSVQTLGLPGAEHVLVRAADCWLCVPGADIADRVTIGDPVDLTRAVGTVTFDQQAVAAVDLGALDAGRVDLVTAAILAAEASGIATWSVHTAVEYAKVRQQFGQPIGSFQAIQHKIALMHVHSEVATAAAWDAARALDDTPDQQALAAAQAVVTAPPVAIDAALDCVQVLGGIGFTWEHDAHLYWRRALAISATLGADAAAEKRLGEIALRVDRVFALVGPDELPELRTEVGAILDEVATLPGELGAVSFSISRGGAKQNRLAEAGLVAPHYPAPYGRQASVIEQAVIAEEFAARNLPQPTMVIGEWVLPTLLQHGTTEQQERFMAPTLRGELMWCQLFSEPGSGSDLASLSTRAVKVDGGWRITGQKVWNSMAADAEWGVCLARTDPEAKKHKGISYFLIDMKSEGVDVRPIKQVTGRSEFNEVFLDDVFVPDDCLVGEPNTGWQLAVTTLANERLSMGNTSLLHGSVARINALRQDGTFADPDRDDVLRIAGRAAAREIAISALNLRQAMARAAGSTDSGVSVLKVWTTLTQREGSREVVELVGPSALVHPADTAADPMMDHLGVPAVLFGGGTIEIQLNVIALRVLGLPR